MIADDKENGEIQEIFCLASKWSALSTGREHLPAIRSKEREGKPKPLTVAYLPLLAKMVSAAFPIPELTSPALQTWKGGPGLDLPEQVVRSPDNEGRAGIVGGKRPAEAVLMERSGLGAWSPMP